MLRLAVPTRAGADLLVLEIRGDTLRARRRVPDPEPDASPKRWLRAEGGT